jgi:ABC-type glycerol-3-phosphate transport system substrate-binding protein
MKKTSIALTLLVCALALVGCGSSSSSNETASSGEQSGGESPGGEGHHAMSPSLTALHDVLAPTWHAEPGATRAGLACTNAAQLEERARAVAADPAPEGQDAAAWTELTTQLTTTASALGAECTASGPAVEERLGAFHDAFHAIIER